MSEPEAKKGYIYIRPITPDGPGLKVTGYDYDTLSPVPGCVETAMNEGDGLFSALLDVNECMVEAGFEKVLDYTQFTNYESEDTVNEITPNGVEGAEGTQSSEVTSPPAEGKTILGMTPEEFSSYIESTNAEIARLNEALDAQDATDSVTDTNSDDGDATTPVEA